MAIRRITGPPKATDAARVAKTLTEVTSKKKSTVSKQYDLAPSKFNPVADKARRWEAKGLHKPDMKMAGHGSRTDSREMKETYTKVPFEGKHKWVKTGLVSTGIEKSALEMKDQYTDVEKKDMKLSKQARGLHKPFDASVLSKKKIRRDI